MKRYRLLFFSLLVVSSLFYSFSLCGIAVYAAAEGYIDVKVDAPESFTHSIMINLTDKEGVNYLITADSVNAWKANNSLPAGDYVVDSVALDIADNTFNIVFPSSLRIAENKGSAFSIIVKSTNPLLPGSAASNTLQGAQNNNNISAEPSFAKSLVNLLLGIVKDNFITLIMIMVLLIILIIRKQRRINSGK